MVFNVARLLFLEVIPIHMPNQHNAVRFANVVRVVRAAEMMGSRTSSSEEMLPREKETMFAVEFI